VYPLTWVIRITVLVTRGVVLLVKVIVEGVIYAVKFLYTFVLPFRMLIQAIAALGKIAYGLWQTLTGDISVLDGLKKMGGAVQHYLMTPFRWARDGAASMWGFIKTLFTGAVYFFQWAGNAIISAILSLPVVRALAAVFRGVRALFSRDKTFFQAGMGILLAIGKGIWSAITLPFRMVKMAFGWIRRLLPFSDAQEGPLSALTAAGRAIITTLCKGILSVAALPLRIIGGVFRGALRIAGAIWSGVQGLVGKGWQAIRDVGANAASALAAPFRLGVSLAGRIWAGIEGVASAGWTAVKSAGASAATILAAPFRWFGKAAAGAWSGVKDVLARGWESVKGTGHPVADVLTAPFRLALAVNRSVWGGMKYVVTAGWDAIKGAGAAAWAAVSAPFRWIGSAASAAWSGIMSAAASAWDGMYSLAGSALSVLAAPFQKLRDVAANAWDWIKGQATGAWESIRNGVGSSVDAVKGMASTAFEAGKSVLSAVADGVKSAITAPYRAVKGALSALRRLLPFSDAQEGPLSNLSASGQAIIETLAGGIERAGKLPATVFAKVWGFLGGIGKGMVAPSITPDVAAPGPVSVEAPPPVIRPQLDVAGLLSRLPLVGGVAGRIAKALSLPLEGDLFAGPMKALQRLMALPRAAFTEMKGLAGAVAAPTVEPQIVRPAPATVGVNVPTVRPQIDTGGILSKLPLIGGLFRRAQPVLSDWGGRLLDGLAGAWDRYSAFWRMMRNGALDTLAVLRQAAGVALPTALSGTLALTPMLSSPLPSVAESAGPSAALVAPFVEAAPMVSLGAAAGKPLPAVVKEREVERTRMLAQRVSTLGPTPPANTGSPDAKSPLAALLSKLDALADRPIDLNVTVVSKLDGRAIAQAVYKDIRQQKIKNYETL